MSGGASRLLLTIMNNQRYAAEMVAARRYRPACSAEARAAYAARREAFRRAASPGRDTSPQAEPTLASIFEEVTADAIERRRDKGEPR